MKSVNKKAVKKAFWGATSRVLGILVSVSGAGLLNKAIGSSISLAVGISLGLLAIGFVLVMFAEYEREID